MSLQKTDTITLVEIIPPTDTTPPSCELAINGKPTGQRVEGCCLEMAFLYGTGYLVIMNHDCPFEETLSIYLLDSSGILQDSAHIFWMYCTGFLTNVQIQQPNKILFEFFENAIWTLHILKEPEFRLPFFSEPTGVHRPLGLKRYFVIAGEPYPLPNHPFTGVLLMLMTSWRLRKTERSRALDNGRT